MDPKFQTSFIPKRPIFPSGLGASAPKHYNFLSLVGTLLFIVTLLLSGGAFLYNQNLSQKNDAKKQIIASEIKAFDPKLTKELSDIKSRIDGGNELLKRHLALSMFFGLLEKSTASTIQFKDFSFKGGPGQTLAVTMRGVAKSFNDAVFQSDIMLESSYIKNQKFSDFTFDTKGDVLFEFSGEIDPSFVLYQKAIDALSTSATTP